MKERATVICERGSRVLLVGKAGARWNLPGGRLKPDETLMQAASRELLEETHLAAVELHYLFAFVGTRTRHHVFLATLPSGTAAAPGREIARCRWFDVAQLERLRASAAVRVIVDMLALARRDARASEPALNADAHRTASATNVTREAEVASRAPATLNAAP
ncbi:NUDIX hydrolase [Paraburkholderia kururiensis]|uniref:NUDIX domain-containing protein n=1 Tax=Paraburkholderia kururiensis TaxID=984307 RepID=A0ABZ0WHW9_9BURK|nr:NUDIX domain-containing protein [Paraburkholderia kururiensis]WQD76925.1 NUDIX domain-containing protein [Paraburkholderia kururiensis]